MSEIDVSDNLLARMEVAVGPVREEVPPVDAMVSGLTDTELRAVAVAVATESMKRFRGADTTSRPVGYCGSIEARGGIQFVWAGGKQPDSNVKDFMYRLEASVKVLPGYVGQNNHLGVPTELQVEGLAKLTYHPEVDYTCLAYWDRSGPDKRGNVASHYWIPGNVGDFEIACGIAARAFPTLWERAASAFVIRMADTSGDTTERFLRRLYMTLKAGHLDEALGVLQRVLYPTRG